jgi:hypothetical protein
MKKGKIIAICIVMGITTVGILAVLLANHAFFSSGGRYDASVLKDIGVPYESQTDIEAWNGGYSTTDACPWGLAHLGLDFMFANNSRVIASAPGLVEEIRLFDLSNPENLYAVQVMIRFNSSVRLTYGFEPWTTNTTSRDQQRAMISVSVGDWVTQGDLVGHFLDSNATGAAHVHWDISIDDVKPCPSPYFSAAAYADIMDLVHSYHIDWELCY